MNRIILAILIAALAVPTLKGGGYFADDQTVVATLPALASAGSIPLASMPALQSMAVGSSALAYAPVTVATGKSAGEIPADPSEWTISPARPPLSGGIGTAIFTTTATWCAPTPSFCAGWGGNAKLAALPGFSGNPYTVLVRYGSKSVLVSVVSSCQCGIDLSPSAFARLAPLSKGRIIVLVEGPITLPELPATDTDE